MCVRARVCACAHSCVSGAGYNSIPTPIIRHFLTDYHRHGKYTGFPRLGLQLQNMENAALRRRQKLPEGGKGVLVQRVEPTGGAAGVLQPGDVLHAYDGVEIASDGTIPFRSGQRIGCTVCLMNKFAGETVEVSFSRDGVMRQTEIATRVIDRVVPAHIDTPMPPYFVCAGLVFTKCTEGACPRVSCAERAVRRSATC